MKPSVPADIYDVVIIGGSYSGLSAALALGRSLRKVIIIDSGQPANLTAAHSHNFLTQDGISPREIAAIGLKQALQYDTIAYERNKAIGIISDLNSFRVLTESGKTLTTKKVIFATGIVDLYPQIPGFRDAWGKSVLHCPYCHGFENKQKKTAVLPIGEQGFEYVMLVAQWTENLTAVTNSEFRFNQSQIEILNKHKISLSEAPIRAITQTNGFISQIEFTKGEVLPVHILYARLPFTQHSSLPQTLGCKMTNEGYIETDPSGKTSIPGIYACGDNSTRNRTISNAVATGTNAALAINKELITESY